MTICIAALADDGKKAVLVTDKMLTLSGLSYQIEKTCYVKNYKVGNCHILAAGDSVAAYEVVRIAQENLKKTIETLPAGTPVASSLEKEIIRKAYQMYRRQSVIQKFLEPRGITLETYYSGRLSIAPQVVMEIENQLQNFNINLEMIVVCKGDDLKYSINYLIHPGELKCFDPVGYVCIGSGTIHSLYHLTGSNYSPACSIKEVKEILSKAKELAEKSPGVGKETTIIECL